MAIQVRMPSIPEQLEFLRKVRAAMDEVESRSPAITEGTTDALAISCNGTWAMWGSGPDIAPLRLVLPDYLGFSYHLGQVDCALNGHIQRNRNTPAINPDGGLNGTAAV